MSLKLSVGLSRKVGQPDFGSLGASCGVEVELDASLLDRDRESFHRRVRDLYALCAVAIGEELGRQQRDGCATSIRRNGSTPAHGSRGARRNGHIDHADRPAMPPQVRALHVLATRLQLDLARLLEQRFSVSLPEELTLASAGRLIRELQQRGAAQG